MKVLFVSSGNNKFGISPIVKTQGDSLKKTGIEVEYFTIKGKGFSGYLKNIFVLRKYLKAGNYNIIHSHFFLSSVVATFSNPSNLVVSLMGSDVYTSNTWNSFIRLLSKRWKRLIVKSDRMKEILKIDNINVIPNGVDLEKFYLVDKRNAREKLNWDFNKSYILFSLSITRPEKNYRLALHALQPLMNKLELITLQNIPHEEIVYYLNAADVLLMTSEYEGSPNIIKEAMACNCPIVTTDVGDVKWVIGETEGCYITTFESSDIRNKINKALQFVSGKNRTKGRERIIMLGLDTVTIADKIKKLYTDVLNNAS